MTSKTKFLYILTAAITLLVIAAGVYFFYFNKSALPNLNQSSSTPNSNLVQDVQFELYKETGQVSFKAENQDNFETLEADQTTLKNKSFVKTGADTLAHIIFSDNSMISLDKNTEVQVVFEAKNRNILQSTGNSWHRLRKITEGGNYQVETSNTLATVRGTIFGLKIEPNLDSGVYVLENQVQVDQTALENGKKVVKNTQLVAENKHLNVPNFDEANEIILTDISDAKKNTDWFERNRLLDSEFKTRDPLEIINKIKTDANFKQKLTDIKTKYANTRDGIFGNLGSLDLNSENLGNEATFMAALLGQNANCAQLVDVQDFTQGITEAEQSGALPTATVTFLKAYYSKLQAFCSDGQLSKTEISELILTAQSLGNSINDNLPNQSNTPTQPSFNPLESIPFLNNSETTTQSNQQFEDDLSARYDLNVANPCLQINSQSYTADLENLRQNQSYFGQDYNTTVAYITALVSACGDGNINSTESQVLNRLINNLGQNNDSTDNNGR